MAGGDPSEALQRAVYAALADAVWPENVLGAGSDVDPVRIYDRPVPLQTDGRQVTGNTVPDFPYVQIGEAQLVGAFATCIHAVEVLFDVHVWSSKSSLLECKSIGDVVMKTLHEAALAIAGYTLVDLAFEDGRYLRDPNGIHRHGVLTFRAQISAL